MERILLSELLNNCGLLTSGVITELDFIPPPCTRLVIENNVIGLPALCLFKLYKTLSKKLEAEKNEIILKNLTLCLLLINPEHYSVWNTRRKLFKDEDIHRELHFTALLISKHPKRACIWNYRWWLISKRLITDENELAQEFNIAGIGAEKYMSNYQAWAYRRKVFHMIPDSLTQELENTTKWTLSHISDYSGWNYKSFLLAFYASTKPETQVLSHLIYEIKETKKLILMYPAHETIWCHLRFCVHATRSLNTLEVKEEQTGLAVPEEFEFNKLCSSFKGNYEEELEFVQEFSIKKLEYFSKVLIDDQVIENQKRFASSYLKWLQI